MIRNYIKIALRNILKNKTFSFINIFGLAVGIAVCLLVITMIVGMKEYDRFHRNYDQLYRVISKRTSGGSWNATSPFPIGNYLLENYDGVKDVVSLRSGFGGDAAIEGNAVPVWGYLATDNFFNVFDFPLLAGNPDQVLKEPYSVVLSQDAARKLFGDADPVGKVIRFSDRGLIYLGFSQRNKPVDLGEFIVTGVAGAYPANSHINFEILASMNTVPALEGMEKIDKISDDWTNIWTTYNYVLLDKKQDAVYLNSILSDISDNKYVDLENRACTLMAQPLAEITPGKLLGNPTSLTLPIEAIYFLSILAVVVIFSACFNYTNLTVARSLTRAREVGIRKVAGALKRQIFGQFLSESIIIALVALILAYGFLQFLKPAFLGLWVNKYLNISYSNDPLLIIIFVIFSIVVGIIAGVLPSYYLSRFKPIKVLKNLGGTKFFGNINLRKSLIIIQFTFSLVFILSTIFVYFQLRYMLHADYGFDKENIINIKLQGNDFEQVKAAIGSHSAITGISGSSFLPSMGTRTSYMVWNAEDPTDSLDMERLRVDGNFVPNFGLSVIAGRNFPGAISEKNTNYVLINEKAVEKWGFENPHAAIGKFLNLEKNGNSVEIIGVVNDFQNHLMMEEADPLMLRYNPEEFMYVNVQVVPGAMEEASRYLEERWKGFDKYHTYEARIYDHALAETHALFGDISYIVGFIAFLAVTIACLGLLGMVTFAAETRTKEIGIRKTMGAQVINIIYQLSKGYFVLLAIAIVLAVPMTWLINDLWLREFANKFDLGVQHYLLGIAVMVLLGVLTIGSQTFKAARTNPVDALRYE